MWVRVVCEVIIGSQYEVKNFYSASPVCSCRELGCTAFCEEKKIDCCNTHHDVAQTITKNEIMTRVGSESSCTLLRFPRKEKKEGERSQDRKEIKYQCSSLGLQ